MLLLWRRMECSDLSSILFGETGIFRLIVNLVCEPQEMEPFEWEIFNGDSDRIQFSCCPLPFDSRSLSDILHFGASMLLGYFSSSSEIPVPKLASAEKNHAGIGLASAAVSIKNKSDDNNLVVGLAHAIPSWRFSRLFSATSNSCYDCYDDCGGQFVIGS